MKNIKTDLSFEDLLNKYYAQNHIIDGNIINVKIIAFQKDYIIVDTCFKCEGLIPIKELKKINGKYDINIGDTIEALIENREHHSGWMLLSREKAQKIRIWDNIEYVTNNEKLIQGTILGKVKGGLQVDIGVKAFLPGSQIDLRPIKDLDTLIGHNCNFAIIKFNKKRGNIVLSRRLVLEKERIQKKKITMQQLKEGGILQGFVKNITEYGVFVDLGGIDGLLHITDMSWGRMQKPQDVFKYGDVIKVKILKYDRRTERVSLGIKQILDDPWTNASKELVSGKNFQGKVVSITDYGIFVELKSGIEGLVHISEVSWNKKIIHPSKIVNIGDVIPVVILDVNISTKRISLGMKQIQSNPWNSLKEKYINGMTIIGKIRNITNYGMFIHMENSYDGFIHINDYSMLSCKKEITKESLCMLKIKSTIINIDTKNRRILLGFEKLVYLK